MATYPPHMLLMRPWLHGLWCLHTRPGRASHLPWASGTRRYHICALRIGATQRYDEEIDGPIRELDYDWIGSTQYERFSATRVVESDGASGTYLWSGLGVSKLVVGSDVQRDWANGIWVLDSIRVEGH
jgi:hypothetical protein